MGAVQESESSSLMIEHIPNVKIEAFRANMLKTSEMVGIIEHFISCTECERRLRDCIRAERDYQPVSISMEFEDWFRHDHLDYEQLVAYLDEKMDAEEREFYNLHLEFCERCNGDVQSLLDFRSRLDVELSYRRTPAQKQSIKEKRRNWLWRPVSAWRPLYSGAVLLIIGLVILFAVFWAKRRPDNFSSQTVDISPSPSISPMLSQTPALVRIPPSQPQTASTPAINRRQASTPGNAPGNEIAVLKDGGTEIRIGKNGVVSGTAVLPADLQQSIKETLLAENIKRPTVLDEVDGEQGSLRGSESRKSRFKLLYPGRTVISQQQPTFRWESLDGATAYEVIVGDSRGRRVSHIDQLPANVTQWTPPSPLDRGEVYSWVVKATINGEKINSPVPPDPEMKFKMLDKAKAKKLEALKKKTQSHVALGMFYAREGMIDDAEREFETLLKNNPNSPVAAALLRSVGSWR